MRKLLLALALTWGFVAPALAVDAYTALPNAAYTVLTTDVRLVPTVAISANRVISLPSASATCVGQTCNTNSLEVVDTFGNVGGANSCLVLTPASSETINGSSGTLTFCSTYGRVVLFPLSGSAWFGQIIGPGAAAGTATNDNAQAGYVGEVITTSCLSNANTATVTITIAAPGVFTDTAHAIVGACPVVFTNSGGGLPTGITSGTTYYVVPGSVTANTYTVATTVANALAGTAVTTTGSSTGTQTRTSGVALSSTTAATVTGIALTAGDWDCRGVVSRVPASSTSFTVFSSAINPAATTIGTQGTTAVHVEQTAANVTGVLGRDHLIGPTRISVSATTNEYLVANDTFSVSTDNGYGQLSCRRAR